MGMALDRWQQQRNLHSLYQKMTVSRKDFPRISNFFFTVSLMVTQSDTVRSFMTASTIQSEVTDNDNSNGSTTKIPRTAFPSDSFLTSKVAPFTFTDTAPPSPPTPTVQSEDTHNNNINSINKELRQLLAQISMMTERMAMSDLMPEDKYKKHDNNSINSDGMEHQMKQGFWQLSAQLSMIFMPEDKYKKLQMESDQRFESMLNKLNQQMNEIFPESYQTYHHYPASTS